MKITGSTIDHSAGRQLLGRMLTYAPGSLVPAVLALVTSMVFTRLFAPAEFGRYSILLVIVTPVKLVFTTWLTQSIGRFLPAEQTTEGADRIKQAISLFSVLVLAFETVLGCVALALSYWSVGASWRAFLLPLLLFFLVSSLFDTLVTVFAADSRAREYVTYKLTDSAVTFAVRLLFVSAVFNMNIALMFWSVAVSNAILLPVMWRRAGLSGAARMWGMLRSPDLTRQAKAFLGFGLPMTVWFFSSVLLDVGDRYVLGFLLGPGPVGIYDASYRLISGLAALMVVPIAFTLHPYLMNLAGSGDTQGVGQVLAKTVETLILAGALCVGVTYLLHRDVAYVLLGAEFREGSVVMPAVLAGVFFLHIGSYAHKPFEIISRTRVMVWFGLASAASNVALCFVLIPLLGYIGAAYATVLSYLLYAVCVGAMGRRVIPWRLDLRRVLGRGGTILAGVVALRVVRSLLDGEPYAVGLAVSVIGSGVLVAAFVLTSFRHSVPSGSTTVEVDAE